MPGLQGRFTISHLLGINLYSQCDIHVRGVIHIQVERLPRVIGTLITSALSALMAWLATGCVH